MQLHEILAALEGSGRGALPATRMEGDKPSNGGARKGGEHSTAVSLAARLGCNHGLAQELWATGKHEARKLALLIGDPAAASLQELDAWARDLDEAALTEAFSTYAIRSSHAPALFQRWSGRPEEWISTAGWLVFRGLLADPSVPQDKTGLAGLLIVLERTIRHVPRQTRLAMIEVLLCIGSHSDELMQSALAVAQRLTTLEGLHGMDPTAELKRRRQTFMTRQAALRGTPVAKDRTYETTPKDLDPKAMSQGKARPKQSTTARPDTRKPVVKKAASRKTQSSNGAGKQAGAKKSSVKKESVKNSTGKKRPTKKESVKMGPQKKSSPRRLPVKKNGAGTRSAKKTNRQVRRG